MGLWILFSVPAQCDRFWLESQACVPVAGTESADQAETPTASGATGPTGGSPTSPFHNEIEPGAFHTVIIRHT